MSIALTLYSRPGCHLCDEMEAVIDRVARDRRATLDVVDISTDAALEALYGVEIPVLLVNGQKIAKYRISEDVLIRALDARRHAAG